MTTLSSRLSVMGVFQLLLFGCGGPLEQGQSLDKALEVATVATPEELAAAEGLSPAVVSKIVALRSGPDGVDGTEDDRPILRLDGLTNAGVGEKELLTLSQLTPKAAVEEWPLEVAETETAEPEPEAAPTATGEMRLDCASLTAEQREYASRRGYCSSGQSITFEAMPPCGTSAMNTTRGTKGVAKFNAVVASNLGAISRVAYDIHWVNEKNGRSGGWASVNYPFFPVWSKKKKARTDEGRVCGTLTGTVKIWWGPKCKIPETVSCRKIL